MVLAFAFIALAAATEVCMVEEDADEDDEALSCTCEGEEFCIEGSTTGSTPAVTGTMVAFSS